MKQTTLRALTIVVTMVALSAIGATGVLAHDTTATGRPLPIPCWDRGMPSDAAGKALRLERITLAPGVTIPTHVHPGCYVISVESGEFGFTVVKGSALITRAGSTTAQPIEAGVEVIGRQGDVFFENGGNIHSARNAGTTPAAVLAASLLVADQPSRQPSNNEGTPTS